MVNALLSNLPLIAFILALLIYSIGAFVILYHLIRFGVGTQPKAVAFIFFTGSVILVLFASVLYINLTL